MRGTSGPAGAASGGSRSNYDQVCGVRPSFLWGRLTGASGRLRILAAFETAGRPRPADCEGGGRLSLVPRLALLNGGGAIFRCVMCSSLPHTAVGGGRRAASEGGSVC